MGHHKQGTIGSLKYKEGQIGIFRTRLLKSLFQMSLRIYLGISVHSDSFRRIPTVSDDFQSSIFYT